MSVNIVFDEVYHDIISWLLGLFDDEEDLSWKVHQLLLKSFKIADLVFGEEEAIKWSQGFTFPSEYLSQSLAEFESVGSDFDKLVRKKFKDISHRRMSAQSVLKALSKDNPEIKKLLRLAKFGLPLLQDPACVFNAPHSIPPISKVYKRVAPAVNRMIYEDFIQKGLAFILPGDVCRDRLKSYHLNRLSWTSKVGKEKGRPLVDCSAGVNHINSDYTKRKSDEVWGEIRHPTIEELVVMIVEYFSSLNGVAWEDLVLWKADLCGAYTLLSFQPDVVRYVGGELNNGDCVFFLSGIFGWTGTPAGFQVVTRAIQFELNKCLRGRARVYVDDTMGVCLRSEVDSEIEMLTKLCETLFNSDCIEKSKTLIGRKLDFIGYSVDLDEKLVSVAEKNYLRCIYAYCSVDLLICQEVFKSDTWRN